MEIFKSDDFEAYCSWFEDPDLSRILGPFDDEWLDHVLSEDPPKQFSFFANNKLVAVIGVEQPKRGESAWYITDIAVDPKRQGQGLGRRALNLLFNTFNQKANEPDSWIAFVDAMNQSALGFFESQGWARSAGVDNDNFYQLSLEMKP